MEIEGFMRKTVGIGDLGYQNHCICKVSASVLRGGFIDSKGKSDVGRNHKQRFC